MAITINGSGITSANIADGTITNADINSSAAIDNSKSAVNVVFHAYESTTTTLTDSTYVKIALNTTSINVGSYFDTSNYKFLPLKAGYYHIYAQVTLDPDGSESGGFITKLDKSGSTYMLNDSSRAGTGRYSGNLEATIYMNGSTDYLELYCYRTDALSQDTQAASYTTFMGGHFLGV